MRRLGLLFSSILGLVLLAPGQARADDVWIGRLTSTGSSVNQTSTAVPFTIEGVAGGTRLVLQCDAPAYVRSGTGSGTVVSSAADATHGELVLTWAFFDIHFQGGRNTIAVISVSGTVDCDVWEVFP